MRKERVSADVTASEVFKVVGWIASWRQLKRDAESADDFACACMPALVAFCLGLIHSVTELFLS